MRLEELKGTHYGHALFSSLTLSLPPSLSLLSLRPYVCGGGGKEHCLYRDNSAHETELSQLRRRVVSVAYRAFADARAEQLGRSLSALPASASQEASEGSETLAAARREWRATHNLSATPSPAGWMPCQITTADASHICQIIVRSSSHTRLIYHVYASHICHIALMHLLQPRL